MFARFLPPGSSSREVALFLRALTRAVRLEGAGRDAVDALQKARLQRVLEAARKTRLYGSSISADDARVGRLDAVAPVSKRSFLARVEDTVAAGDVTRAELDRWIRDRSKAGQLLNGRYLVAMTSGTSGQVGIFLNDLESWAETRAITFARIFRRRFGVTEVARMLKLERYRMAFIVASGGHYMTSLLAGRVPRLGSLAASTHVLSIEMPVPVIVRQLNEKNPHLLHSYPTLLELLAHEQRRGTLRIAPEIITAGSEPMTPTCRQALVEAFPEAQLVETYASTECVPMGTSCPYGSLHVNEDACLLEPVGEDGRPVPPGTRADRVFVTNLINTAQPLVRYELTDQLQLEAEPCGCGSPFGRVLVHGRSDDTFFLRDLDGAFQAHPPIPLEIVFLAVPGLLQYQLVHERQNELRVLFVTEPGVPGQQVAGVLDAQLWRYLADHGLDESVSFTLEEVEAIERNGESKKVRQILSHVERPSGEARSGLELRERRRRPRVS